MIDSRCCERLKTASKKDVMTQIKEYKKRADYMFWVKILK